ncbi:DUF4783 domain-containing protein [Microbacter margulisiae]|uniref:DUF4783 domain-containing protein n=1 Tax=Microbacter margulisiae TaxID=1350067 RepID=A0A7W5DRE0_9PORP|nr:DUF4783 domain-containing protein [Microbacter margulisiae]MBB3187328.1 hypothetical protein [Microbacter margulisiae]
MKRMNRFLILVCVSVFFVSICQAQTTDNLTKKISNAFNTQNIGMLSDLFSNDAELTLPDGNNFRKDNLDEQLNRFIRQKKVSGFEALHEGEKGNRMFIIGNLHSPSATYRINLFLKNESGNFLIYQIKIE